MNFKKNIRKVEKETFDECILCDQCKKGIHDDTEITVNQNIKRYNSSDFQYRDFHFCNIHCLKKFLDKSEENVFEECDPLGFYFTKEDLK